MRRRNCENLRQVLDQTLRENHLDVKLNEVRLMAKWPEVVGTGLAAQTSGLRIHHRVLHLHVNSAIVRHELVLLRQNLLKRLNEAVGESVIDDIQIR